MSISNDDFTVYQHEEVDSSSFEFMLFTMKDFEGNLIFQDIDYKAFMKNARQLGFKGDCNQLLEQIRMNEVEVSYRLDEAEQQRIEQENEKNINEKLDLFKNDLFKHFSLDECERTNVALDISISLSKKYNYKQIFYIFGKLMPLIKI